MRLLLLTLLITFTFSGNCLPLDVASFHIASSNCENDIPLFVKSLNSIYNDNADLEKSVDPLKVKAIRLSIKATTKACCSVYALDPSKNYGIYYLEQLVRNPVKFFNDHENNIKSLKEETAALVDCLTTNNYKLPEPSEINEDEGSPVQNTGNAYIDSHYRGGRY